MATTQTRGIGKEVTPYAIEHDQHYNWPHRQTTDHLRPISDNHRRADVFRNANLKKVNAAPTTKGYTRNSAEDVRPKRAERTLPAAT